MKNPTTTRRQESVKRNEVLASLGLSTSTMGPSFKRAKRKTQIGSEAMAGIVFLRKDSRRSAPTAIPFYERGSNEDYQPASRWNVTRLTLNWELCLDREGVSNDRPDLGQDPGDRGVRRLERDGDSFGLRSEERRV